MSAIITDIQNALKSESILNPLSGWIFTNFHNRDAFTDELLSINRNHVSTRRWIYIVPSEGEPVKILHAIEPHALDGLPCGKSYSYSGIEGLKAILKEYARTSEGPFAILSDRNIPVISTVDAGFVSVLDECGIRTVTAAPLIQRCKGLLSPEGIESQERAATVLYNAVYDAWSYISHCFNNKLELTEYAVQQLIMKRFEDAGLVTDNPPIVAFGAHAGDPHYEPTAENHSIACEGDVIQLDMWAKEKDGIYADISWVGVYGTDVPEKVAACFETLTEARDSVFAELSSRKDAVHGAALDRTVRSILIEGGYEDAIRHRTGHGIDTECHGSGVNLDSVEFPDERLLLEGSCFSVEPGLYFSDFGLRTEIDMYIKNGKPVISGASNKIPHLTIPQDRLLTIFPEA